MTDRSKTLTTNETIQIVFKNVQGCRKARISGFSCFCTFKTKNRNSVIFKIMRITAGGLVC